jgi:hypothetical protein
VWGGGGSKKKKQARNFFLGLTGMMALTTALTDWSPRRRRARRHN